MHLFDTLNSVGGGYVALFVVAMISGVFPVAYCEVALIALARSVGSWPILLLLAAIVTVGQCVTFASLYQSARGLTKLGEKRRKRFEAQIARARAVIARWQTSEMVLLGSAATIGLPPLMLVSVVAGALGIQFRTFSLVALLGRFARFATIAIVAYVA